MDLIVSVDSSYKILIGLQQYFHDLYRVNRGMSGIEIQTRLLQEWLLSSLDVGKGKLLLPLNARGYVKEGIRLKDYSVSRSLEDSNNWLVSVKGNVQDYNFELSDEVYDRLKLLLNKKLLDSDRFDELLSCLVLRYYAFYYRLDTGAKFDFCFFPSVDTGLISSNKTVLFRSNPFSVWFSKSKGLGLGLDLDLDLDLDHCEYGSYFPDIDKYFGARESTVASELREFRTIYYSPITLPKMFADQIINNSTTRHGFSICEFDPLVVSSTSSVDLGSFVYETIGRVNISPVTVGVNRTLNVKLEEVNVISKRYDNQIYIDQKGGLNIRSLPTNDIFLLRVSGEILNMIDLGLELKVMYVVPSSSSSSLSSRSLSKTESVRLSVGRLIGLPPMKFIDGGLLNFSVTNKSGESIEIGEGLISIDIVRECPRLNVNYYSPSNSTGVAGRIIANVYFNFGRSNLNHRSVELISNGEIIAPGVIEDGLSDLMETKWDLGSNSIVVSGLKEVMIGLGEMYGDAETVKRQSVGTKRFDVQELILNAPKADDKLRYIL